MRIGPTGGQLGQPADAARHVAGDQRPQWWWQLGDEDQLRRTSIWKTTSRGLALDGVISRTSLR